MRNGEDSGGPEGMDYATLIKKEEKRLATFPEGFTASASDVERFCYCPLSFFYEAFKSLPTREDLRRGEKEHRRLASILSMLSLTEYQSQLFEKRIMWLALAATITALYSMAFFSLHRHDALPMIFLILSLFWILFGLFFLYAAESVNGEKADKTRLAYEKMILVGSIVAMILATFGFSSYLPPDENLVWGLSVAALFVLIGAVYFLYLHLKKLAEAARIREEEHLSGGKIKEVDTLKEQPPVKESRRYHLRGTPDFIVEKDGVEIPVEVKTGRTPKGPLFSHIAQIGCYCLLLEEKNGVAPPYGIIRYGSEKEFRIDFDARLRFTVLQKIGDILYILQTRTAPHRNHNRPGKCARCSRKDVCSERIDIPGDRRTKEG